MNGVSRFYWCRQFLKIYVYLIYSCIDGTLYICFKVITYHNAFLRVCHASFKGILKDFFLWFQAIRTWKFSLAENTVVAPCDGVVVAIEEVDADEYFKDRRIQVSIFMSPLNVHVNRNAVGGEVLYSEYHKGKYLVAWHPKSSIENERHTVVYKSGNREILVKQIAGAVAKRIVNYLKPGQMVNQGEEMGFIKFGSRVDLLLPLDSEITVKLKENTRAGISLIAKL